MSILSGYYTNKNSELRTQNSELLTFHFIYEKKFGFL